MIVSPSTTWTARGVIGLPGDSAAPSRHARARRIETAMAQASRSHARGTDDCRAGVPIGALGASILACVIASCASAHSSIVSRGFGDAAIRARDRAAGRRAGRRPVTPGS